MTVPSHTPIGAAASVTDHALAHRHVRAVERASALIAADPLNSPRALAGGVVRRYRQDLAWAGALTGAVGAVPAVSVPAAAIASLPSIACLATRTADMILTVASLGGHTLDDLHERRNVVLGLMSVAGAWDASSPSVLNGAANGIGARVVEQIPRSAVSSVNRAIGRTVVTKYAAQTGAVRLGTVAPFGIGIVLGAGGNFLIGHAVGRAAIRTFFATDGGGA